MSAKIKAVAAALQAKGMDLTQYRQRSTRDSRIVRVRPDVAAGALAFAATDIEVDGEQLAGDALPGMLLRLKYAEQRSPGLFRRVQLIILHRHYRASKRSSSAMLEACAAGALAEWMVDGEIETRGRKRFQQRKQRGVRRFSNLQRWAAVSHALGDFATALKFDDFGPHWVQRYCYFLDALYAAERGMGVGLDLHIEPGSNRAQAPQEKEEVGDPSDAP